MLICGLENEDKLDENLCSVESPILSTQANSFCGASQYPANVQEKDEHTEERPSSTGASESFKLNTMLMFNFLFCSARREASPRKPPAVCVIHQDCIINEYKISQDGNCRMKGVIFQGSEKRQRDFARLNKLAENLHEERADTSVH
ncbi:hypothetical protein T265_10477 [Opisthorchis viverrini]|uniref:Uncharacterized protein n=1 Tax=Opisthorchis viverrini TaxID=6198 RepID=A0A074Z6D3_OPIVI|nr:hypothetical protein T265_10477 [Opisthorchis viverrini]KER21117.1 hypothetical protein T265_10477 [Opisthorchis viverrini]